MRNVLDTSAALQEARDLAGDIRALVSVGGSVEGTILPRSFSAIEDIRDELEVLQVGDERAAAVFQSIEAHWRQLMPRLLAYVATCAALKKNDEGYAQCRMICTRLPGMVDRFNNLVGILGARGLLGPSRAA